MTDHIAQFDAGETLAKDGRNIHYAMKIEKLYHMFENAYDHISNNPKLYDKYIGDAIIEALE